MIRLRYSTGIAFLASGVALSACGAAELPLEGMGGGAGQSIAAGSGPVTGSGGSAGQATTGSGGATTGLAGAAMGNSGNAGSSAAPNAAHEIDGDPYGDFGDNAAFVGDLDGDGFDDLVVVDGGGTGPERALAAGTRGAVYGFYGRADFPQQLAAGDADFILDGSGEFINALGDVDGDGFDDFAFTQYCDPLNGCLPTNGVHIVFGGATRLAGEHRSDEVGVTWLAPRDDARYVNVSAAGDVNGDGYADVLVDAGTLGTSPGNTLEVVSSYLLLGRSDRSALVGAAPDATFEGQNGKFTVTFGSTGVGDLDGDGYDDLVISTENVTSGVFTGTINLFYGAPDRFHGSFAPGDSDADFDWLSSFVTLRRFGDLDGDGAQDLALSSGDSHDDIVRIVYGSHDRFAGSYGTDAAGLTLTSGYQFSGLALGDMNGDGYLDILVGDNSANNGNGWLALIPGTGARRTGTYAISEQDVILNGQTRGSVLDDLGDAVSTGDINGDGLDDVVVGAITNYGGDLDGGREFLILGAKQ